MADRLRYNVVVPTAYGMMIVNRNDAVTVPGLGTYGVGYELMINGCYQPEELEILGQLLAACAADPVVLDVGANVGVHSLFFAERVGEAGRVIAFEPQRIVHQMLLGNLALNSVENVWTHHVAVGAREGWLTMKQPVYTLSGNFGGTSLPVQAIVPGTKAAPAGDPDMENVRVITLDSLGLERVDLMKIDVEEMELDVLLGATATLDRFRPLLQVEWLRRDEDKLPRFLRDELDYRVYVHDMNLICVPDEKHEKLSVQYPLWDAGLFLPRERLA